MGVITGNRPESKRRNSRAVRRAAWLVATLLIVVPVARALPIKENAGYVIHLDRSSQRLAQLWNDDVDVGSQVFIGGRPGEQWILPHWRFDQHPLPGTLRYGDIELQTIEVPQHAEAVILTVEDGTGRYRYVTPEGVEHAGDQLNAQAMLAWMNAAGALTDAAYVREEAAHAAMIIDHMARDLPQPTPQQSDPVTLWRHGGVRYHLGYRPIPIMVVMVAIWLGLLLWGRKRI